MAPEQLLEQIKRVAQAFAQETVCRTLLEHADTDVERARLETQFDQWDRQVARLWADLAATVNSALPPTLHATPDPIAPVTTPNSTTIEVRGALDDRSVAIRLTAAQAVAVGSTLIAYAAVVTDRAGNRVGAILPPVPATPAGQPIRPT